eukprot:911399-Amphidinium_carterae.1
MSVWQLSQPSFCSSLKTLLPLGKMWGGDTVEELVFFAALCTLRLLKVLAFGSRASSQLAFPKGSLPGHPKR